MTHTTTLGQTTVVVTRNTTTTYFADSTALTAVHDEQPGQAERAAQLGYATAEDMNREHDLAHSLLAHWLGLDYSPTLFAVAHGQTSPLWEAEESAVLAIQRFARAAGVDLLSVAKP